MHTLKPRLEMVYRSVPKNSVVADIGTDHAFLPIALIERGRAKKVIACDINEGPLNVATKNVQKAGVDNIELRLSDGLDKISNQEVDVVTIAGMGGDVISRIIESAGWLKENKTLLILQPMSSAEDLRVFLSKEGFKILTEKAVFDNRRIYSVITAQYCGAPVEISLAQKYIGELEKDKSETATKYIIWQKKIINSIEKSLKNVERKQELYNEITQAKGELETILNNR